MMLKARTAAVMKVAEAKARLSELLARVERGEEFIIARGGRPVARLARLGAKAGARVAVETMLALRDNGRIKSVTQDEIRAWIGEGRSSRGLCR